MVYHGTQHVHCIPQETVQSIVLHIKIKLLDARMKGRHGFEIHVVCTFFVIGLPSHLQYVDLDSWDRCNVSS